MHSNAPRINAAAVTPEGYQALSGVERYIATSSLDRSLVHLVKLRASQINGCAFCIDMHWKDARAAGESEQRLYGLDAWHESPYYTERERAALRWTESLTRIAETRAPDEDFAALRAHFSDREIADLTVVIGMINCWNRLAIGLRWPSAGSYQPPRHSAAPEQPVA